MNAYVKKFFRLAPRPLKRAALLAYESYWRGWSFRQAGLKPEVFKHFRSGKSRVLFYFISGLSYGGTSKMMQGFAKYLDPDKFDVYFMYSSKPRMISGGDATEEGRKFYFENTGVKLIQFGYNTLDTAYPFLVRYMQPTLQEVIKENNIDILVTTSTGYTEFPFNMIADLPIVNFNIFGAPAVQENILTHICISREVAARIRDVVDEERIEVVYIPSEEPPMESVEWGRELRLRLGLKDNNLVFGRIGRAVDGIFDPIGIRAFQKLVGTYPQAHFLIMAPPPILEKLVREEKIPNVHFLPASGADRDIWSFHQAIDILAHFRHDGESCGLNIGESMLCGKPVLTHKSRYWNAHLEYLDESFSRVADIGDVDGYRANMEYFLNLPKADLVKMGQEARLKGEVCFSIKTSARKFEGIINRALNHANRQ